METYLCSGGRRRRRWRGGCFILFPGVASLSFGLFFFCRHEMVAPLFFFPSLLCLFAFVFGKKAFGLGGPKLSRVLYSGSAPVFALVFSLPASVFFPGFALFCLWFSGPIPLCSASQFPPVLPLSFLPVLPPLRSSSVLKIVLCSGSFFFRQLLRCVLVSSVLFLAFCWVPPPSVCSVLCPAPLFPCFMSFFLWVLLQFSPCSSPCLCSALPFIEPEHAEKKTRPLVHQSMSWIMGKKSWCRGPRFAANFLLNRLHPLKRGRR